MRAGNKLIFTTSFGYMEPTLKVAKKYPNVHFEHATGFKRDKNMSTYSAGSTRAATSRASIAAKMSKSGVLGYIGSFPIPEVISGINATMLGAQTVNPNIKVKIIWVNTWFDPGKEADAAKALLDQGADVIMQHTDSPAAMQIASRARQARVRPGFRNDQVRPEGAADLDHGQLGALLHRPRQGRARRQLEVGRHLGRLEVEDGRDGALHQHARRREEAGEDTEAAITDGKLIPFKCPVVGQDGKEVECKGGDHLADGQVLGMNFYVKGIDDKIPGK